jgi:SAM-dependent methyltransferase
MLKIDSAINKIADEIEEVYQGRSVFDYKGKRIDQERVTRSLFDTYYRIKEIAEYVSGLGRNKKILDIGMAYGFYDIVLKDVFGHDVAGMEVEENIGAYCLLPELHGIQIIRGGLSKKPCPIPDNSFDVVIFSQVLEHLRISPMTALMEIKRILKPGGLLLLRTPNMARLSNILRLLTGTNIVEGFPDSDDELDHITDKVSHLREYTMKELKVLMGQAGYKIMKAEYSLASDRISLNRKLGFMQKLKRLLILPALKIVPGFRSSVLILGQK